MKYFVVSDVHSFYDELMEALKYAGFDEYNPEHFIISCGDACDRGPNSMGVLKFLLRMKHENRAILIKGNHEDLMKDAINRRYFMSHDIHNGAIYTAQQLTGKEDYDDALWDMETNELWNEYYNSCVDYYEKGNFIFVHGWIPLGLETSKDEKYNELPENYKPVNYVYDPNWRNFMWGDEWKDARWLNGMKMWWLGYKEPNKTIVCGHWHTSWGHSKLHNDGVEYLKSIETYHIDPDTGKEEPHVNHGIFYDDGIIAIDACTAISHKVNVLVMED